MLNFLLYLMRKHKDHFRRQLFPTGKTMQNLRMVKYVNVENLKVGDYFNRLPNFGNQSK